LRYRQAAPPGKLSVSFPADAGNRRVKARVLRNGWRRVHPGTKQGDVAVLELVEDAPAGCSVPPLLCPPEFSDHGFVTMGFPRNARRMQPGGAPAKGVIGVASGPGTEWQLLVDDAATLIRPGFSGAPVWDEAAEAVVGIVVARDTGWVRSREERSKGAFMIPLSRLIDTWEPLRRRVGWRARFDPQCPLHWDPLSRGTQGGDDPEGDLFTGRRKVLGEIAGWLGDPEPKVGARVVTGGAGAGKSSVIARIVMGADPDEEVTIESDPPPPPIDPIAVAVLCREDGRGLELQEIVSRIARWTDVAAKTAEGLIAALEQKARATRRVPTIVVDQLDEAARPHDLISLLLRPLAERGAARILVGLAKEYDDVLPAAFGDTAEVLDLDRYADNEDLQNYVERLLLRHGDPYQEGSETTRVATEVAGQTSPLFLVARLVALYLAGEAEVAGPQTAYPTSVDDAMQEYLDRIARAESTDEPGRRRIKRTVSDLMGALAYSQGPGLPLGDGTWQAVAKALDGNSYDDQSIERLRDSAARYLLQARTEDGVTYYRLFHRALANALKRKDDDAAIVHARIVTGLAALTPLGTEEPALPYVRERLSSHAFLAKPSAWRHLAEEPETLDRLAPIPLRRDAARAALAGHPLPPELLGVLASAHLMQQSGLGDRAGLRQLGKARVTDRRTFGPTDASVSLARWTIASAVLRRHAAHVTIGVDSGVRALTCVESRDDQPLLVGACGDGSIRTWSPDSGELVAEISLGTGGLQALAACNVQGEPRVAVGSADGRIHLFDPERAGSSDFASGHRAPGGVRSLAVFVLQGKMYTASGGDEHWIKVQDGAGGDCGALPVPGPVRAVTARTVGDQVELAAGADDGRVTIWRLGPSDLAEPGGSSPAKELEGPTDWIRAVLLVGDQDDAVVVAGAEDGGVYLWPADAKSGSAGERLNGPGAAVLAATPLTSPSGDLGFATAGRDSVIDLWSADGVRTGEPLTGTRSGAVCDLVTYRLDGQRGLASADEGGVRIWTHRPPSTPQVDSQPRPVVAVANCPAGADTLAVTGDDGGIIRLWEPDKAEPRTPGFGSDRAIPRVITHFSHPTGSALAVGGDDEQVRFVRAVTGSPIEGVSDLRGHHGPVRAISLDVDGAAFVTGAEDGTVRFWDAEHTEAVDRRIFVGPPVRGLQSLDLPDHGVCMAIVGPGRGVTVHALADPTDTIASVEMHTDWAMAVAVQPRALAPLIVTVGDDGAVWAYDLLANTEPKLIGRHEDSVRALAVFGNDHLVATGGDDGTVRLWDPRSTEPARGRLRVGSRVNGLCGVDQRLLVGTDEGHLIVNLSLA
jgi:WD40 repeat protein